MTSLVILVSSLAIGDVDAEAIKIRFLFEAAVAATADQDDERLQPVKPTKVVQKYRPELQQNTQDAISRRRAIVTQTPAAAPVPVKVESPRAWVSAPTYSTPTYSMPVMRGGLFRRGRIMSSSSGCSSGS